MSVSSSTLKNYMHGRCVAYASSVHSRQQLMASCINADSGGVRTPQDLTRGCPLMAGHPKVPFNQIITNSPSAEWHYVWSTLNSNFHVSIKIRSKSQMRKCQFRKFCGAPPPLPIPPSSSHVPPTQGHFYKQIPALASWPLVSSGISEHYSFHTPVCFSLLTTSDSVQHDVTIAGGSVSYTAHVETGSTVTATKQRLR